MRKQTHILFTSTIIAKIMIPKPYIISMKCMYPYVLLNYMFSVRDLIIITKKIFITITLPITHLIQIHNIVLDSFLTLSVVIIFGVNFKDITFQCIYPYNCLINKDINTYYTQN